MKKITLVLLLLVLCINFSFGQDNISRPIVQTPVYFDISPPLRDMVKQFPGKAETSWKDGIVKNKFNIRPRPRGMEPGGQTDPFLQTINGVRAVDTTIVNFDGNTNNEGYIPPDTHGDVGPNHYFQVVNSHYSIYSKTGTLLLGPLLSSSVFSGMTNNSNDGDAVVLYDEQADRWVFSQFSLPSYPNGPFYQMIAISTTPDPTGSWYRYQYSFTNMPDYPKFGVWGDGYYMSMHIFTAGTGTYAGIGAVAYNRTLMLAGSPAATMIMFTKPSTDEAFGWLPSDCDGPFPTGNPPNYFLYSYDGTSNDHLGIYEFHVDWVTTANSTFTNFLSLPVTAFTTTMTGVTQKGSTVKLDVINDRMMYRLQYRSFGGYSSMVCNHTVDVSSTVAGIRWYELRKTTGSWSIYQQGTYSLADNNSRWMGSIAMDSSGNIALGYSVSGTNLYPSIRYTGRKKNDALNTMTIAERGIFNGGGAQTGGTRWGDYSAMSCDPSAKATYWYTQEYYSATSSTSWKTRIASFRFANTPTAATLAATSVTGTGGTLNGTVNPNGLATNYYFQWGTTTSYGSNTTSTAAGSGTSAIAVNATLTGLTGGTTYHYRLAAVNSDGTSYGNDFSFTPGLAVVTTTAATAITQATATSGGNVTTDGGSTVTARGVCWATTANPVVSGSHTTDGSGTGTFTSSITGLSANTTYHVRAYATNSAGTVYGNDLTFITVCGVFTLPFTESFTNTTIPNCWTQVDNQGSGQIWQFGAITGYTPLPALTGNYAYLNSDAYGSGSTQNADLITPTLNLTGYTAVNLAFKHYFRFYTGSSAKVSYSINNGSTWTVLLTYSATTANPAAVSQAVNAVAGQSQVKFKWNYTGTYGYYWGIDDINITGTGCTPVAVSVAIAASINPSCAGSSVTFTATPTNGGTTPAYQWKVNGTSISGATNVTYAYAPANNDLVTCVLTSNAACTTGNPATSNTITMTVTPLLSVGSVSASQSLCENATPGQLTGVAPLNGTSPTYQWQSSLNNSTFTSITGATILTYQPGSLAVTTYYRQLQNATGTCGGPLPTNSVTMTITPNLPVSVSVAASSNPVCAGTSVTFTATPVNGGTPTYQWFKNTTAVGTGATYSYIPVNGDQVYVVMTSSITCKTGSPATSNTVTMIVNPLLPVSVTIAPSANQVCAGTSVTFTATPVNGGTPTYQWFKNTIAVGTGATYSYVPVDGDQVYVVMTSSVTCKTGSPATSNTVTMIVNPLLPVSVSIAPSANQVCAGTTVTFTPTPVNGGTPTYQWFKNTIAVGTDATYSYVPVDGDQVYVVMTSSVTCKTGSPATSNTVTMIVNPLLPVSVSIAPSANQVCAGTTVTFTPTPVNGGTATYQWFINTFAVGTGATYSYIPVDGDQVYVVMTSSITCKTGSPATSNTVTMIVNPLLPVSVSVAPSTNQVCAGTSVTFTPTPVNGGTATYQWFKNTIAVGTDATYSCIPVDGDQVYAVMTSSLTCQTGSPATSNTVTMIVNPLLPVSVSVAPSANQVCAGTSVTFTATPVNGGTPTYQWFKNTIAVGTDATYSFVPVDGDEVYAVMTSSLTCKTGSPATSNTVTMIVNPLLPVSVSIAPSANQVCAGTSVTFTPTPVNGGNPVYQWYKNTIDAGNGTTYSYVPADGDHIYVVMTSDVTCKSGSPAASNTIIMAVDPVLTLTNEITATQTTVCAGTSVTLSCTHNYPVLGCDWYVNGTIVSHAMDLTYVPVNNDQVYCVCWVTPGGCWSSPSATSNTITLTVDPVLPVSVSIIASANPVDPGIPVTFTASATNGGALPHYQWRVNATNAGTNNAVFIYTPVNGDAVSCVLTSAESCTSTNPAASNTIDMVVNAVPLATSLQNVTITGNQCFNAVQTIIVAGGQTFFTVQNGGSATMIAGENILYYPGTVVEPGGYMSGYIVAPEGPWCTPQRIIAGTTEPLPGQNADQHQYRIYPNPTTGTFMFELIAPEVPGKCLVEIYNMKGEKMLSKELSGERKHEFSLLNKPTGIYLVRVISDGNSGTTRIIKQ